MFVRKGNNHGNVSPPVSTKVLVDSDDREIQSIKTRFLNILMVMII